MHTSVRQDKAQAGTGCVCVAAAEQREAFLHTATAPESTTSRHTSTPMKPLTMSPCTTWFWCSASRPSAVSLSSCSLSTICSSHSASMSQVEATPPSVPQSQYSWTCCWWCGVGVPGTQHRQEAVSDKGLGIHTRAHARQCSVMLRQHASNQQSTLPTLCCCCCNRWVPPAT